MKLFFMQFSPVFCHFVPQVQIFFPYWMLWLSGYIVFGRPGFSLEATYPEWGFAWFFSVPPG
jgi:hypothetical protein